MTLSKTSPALRSRCSHRLPPGHVGGGLWGRAGEAKKDRVDGKFQGLGAVGGVESGQLVSPTQAGPLRPRSKEKGAGPGQVHTSLCLVHRPCLALLGLLSQGVHETLAPGSGP